MQEDIMSKITLKGEPINTIGELPEIGTKAPDFVLTKTDLSDAGLKDFTGKQIILNIFPSIDTPVCAASVRRFNSEADKLSDTIVLCISADLPFAHSRFCAAEGLKNVIPLSEMHEKNFGEKYGVRIIDGPLKGLLSRAIVTINKEGKVIYIEQVPDIKQEPDYEKALKALI
jgi:thioredoxin-dependent peroxiredoxin